MNSHAPEAFASNRRRLFELMPDRSAMLLMAASQKIRSGDTPYPYCQDKNFYYLTGHTHRQAALLLIKNASKTDTRMFVIELTPVQKHWLGHLPGPAEVREATGIESVLSIRDLPEVLSRSLKNTDILYVDFEPAGLHEPLNETLQLADTLHRKNPHLAIRRAFSLLARLREIKADWEVNRIRKAIGMTRDGITRILAHMAPGAMEYQMEAWFNLELHLQKTVPAFPTIAAAGRNATILHYTSVSDPLPDESLLLLDLGAEYLHYSADISRTVPISGRFSPAQRALYNLVLEANQRTIDAAKPGLTFNDLNNVTRKILGTGMKKLKYISNWAEISRYYTHGVSHPLGLDTHDVHSGHFSTLQPGMVVTIEPGLYIEEEGIGIRIEDDILITDTAAPPSEVERLRKKGVDVRLV